MPFSLRVSLFSPLQCFWRLPRLLVAIIMDNFDLYGTIADTLYDKNTTLKFLAVSNTNVSGTLPPSICGPTFNLLSVSGSPIGGQLPACLFKKGLVQLLANRAAFTGNVPPVCCVLLCMCYM